MNAHQPGATMGRMQGKYNVGVLEAKALRSTLLYQKI